MNEESLLAGVLLLPLASGLASLFGVLAFVSLVNEVRRRRRRFAPDSQQIAWGARFLVALGASVVCLAGPFAVLGSPALAERANQSAPLWVGLIAVGGLCAIYFVGKPSR